MKHTLGALVSAAFIALAPPALVALSERPAHADDPERRHPDPLLSASGSTAPPVHGDAARVVSFSQLDKQVQDAIKFYHFPSKATYGDFTFELAAAVNPVARETKYDVTATYNGTAQTTSGVKVVYIFCGVQQETDPAEKTKRPFSAVCLDGTNPQELVPAGPIQPDQTYTTTVTRKIRSMQNTTFDRMPFYAPHVDLHFPSGPYPKDDPPHVGLLLERVQASSTPTSAPKPL